MAGERPALPAPASTSTRALSWPAGLLWSLRPHQWTKNLLVFVPLIFAQRLRDPAAIQLAGSAFVIFCLLSGAIYLVNDVHDRDADRRHPLKARRPIAAGIVSPPLALGAAAVLGAGAILWAFLLGRWFGVVAATYLGLLTIYSTWLKHVVILDVVTLAAGFVLRALGGATVIDVEFSHWLLLLTLLGALFIGLSKRRAELVGLADDATGHRRILAEYSPLLLDQMISVVTASMLLAYALYTTSPETVGKLGTDKLIYTVPFILYGIFRYLYLVHQREGGGNPSELLVRDRPLIICGALWTGAVILILYGPWK